LERLYLDDLKILEDKLSKDGIILFHNAIPPPPPPNLIDEVNRRWRYIVVLARLGILIVIGVNYLDIYI